MIGYYTLLLAALAANFRDVRMFALSCVVGFGVLVPIPVKGFYFACIAVECGVALAALYLAAQASRTIIRITALLVIFHALGWLFNGYPPESPYHIMVKISEHAELVACIVLSRPFTKMVNHA